MSDYVKCEQRRNTCKQDTKIFAFLMPAILIGIGFSSAQIYMLNRNNCLTWNTKTYTMLGCIAAFLMLTWNLNFGFKNKIRFSNILEILYFLAILVMNLIVFFTAENTDCSTSSDVQKVVAVINLVTFIVLIFFIAGY